MTNETVKLVETTKGFVYDTDMPKLIGEEDRSEPLLEEVPRPDKIETASLDERQTNLEESAEVNIEFAEAVAESSADRDLSAEGWLELHMDEMYSDIADAEEDAEPSDAEIVETIENVPATTIDEIAEFELDPDRRRNLIAYAEQLSPDDQLNLLDTLKVVYGPTPKVVSLDYAVKDIIHTAHTSRLLKAKNTMTIAHLQQFGKLAQQVQRLLSGSFTDDTVNSLKIDGTLKYINNLERTITILSTGIYDMASRVGMEKYVEPENMPVNIDRLLKVLCTVSHGVKQWATVSVNAEKLLAANKQTIDSLTQTLKDLREQVETARLDRERILASERNGMLKDSAFYYIMNHSGFYLASLKEPDEDGVILIAPGSTYVTHNADEALSFDTLESARTAMDAIHRWHKYKKFNHILQKANVRLNTLFIAQTIVRKVEG